MEDISERLDILEEKIDEILFLPGIGINKLS